jgi:dynein assembly factor 3
VNLFVSGSCDLRHIFETLRNVRDPSREYVFYIHEHFLEVIARQLVLLAILLDPEQGDREKCESFLEVYANLRVREPVRDVLDRASRMVLDALTHERGLLLPHVDFSLLKHKDRDTLETILRTYLRSPEDKVAPLLTNAWDERLRSFYKDRFDHRLNLIDWDHSMNLATKASIVHHILFTRWRMTGQGYEYRSLNEASYSAGNPTLLASIKGKPWYWGDIVQSPFIAYGTFCDDPAMYAKTQDQHTKSAMDIGEAVVQQYIDALLPKETATGKQEGPAKKLKWKLVMVYGEMVPQPQGITISDDAKVQPAEVFSTQRSLVRKLQGAFHVVYLAALRVHLMPLLRECMVAQPGAHRALFVETTKWLVELRKEHHARYVEKITGMTAGWADLVQNGVRWKVPVLQSSEDAMPSFLSFLSTNSNSSSTQ